LEIAVLFLYQSHGICQVNIGARLRFPFYLDQQVYLWK
jgi:hypothetical protein